LSEASESDLSRIIHALAERRKTEPRYKRIFGKVYMAFRHDTEKRLRELFISAGGKPERLVPHYFVLGESLWFSGLYPETKYVTLPIDKLSPLTVSFTYPDSGIAMGMGTKYGLPPEPVRPYHNRVYRISELDEVVTTYGLPDASPDEGYENYHHKKFEKYIEVQLWTDDPIRQFLEMPR
jgi:hypothetical protein